jgi:hypothetical protein
VRKFIAVSTVLCTMLVGLVTVPDSVSANPPPTTTAAVQTILWGPCSDPVLTAAQA